MLNKIIIMFTLNKTEDNYEQKILQLLKIHIFCSKLLLDLTQGGANTSVTGQW